MPFLSGSLGFERFRVDGLQAEPFGQDQIEAMERLTIGKFQTSATENVHVGFLAGSHLFDHDFALEKNVINEALHCCVRIDTNQIPSAIRRAWLQMELAALTKDNTSGRPTKSQRQEAKEAVEQRCEVEAATGKYRKMQQFPVLWDIRQSVLYFGGSGDTVSGHCADLFQRAFDVELSRTTAGSVARQWAEQTNQAHKLADLVPAAFLPHQPQSVPAWANVDSPHPDFLGNEFVLWLWWTLENQSDTLGLPDDSEVTVMLNRTLTLECPRGESGKETIAAEAPVRLPEAMQAIRSGKLPRKSGMSLVRHGQQFDLVLQAETFAISGGKIHVDDDEADADRLDNRIEAIRCMNETVDLLFQTFCSRRISGAWPKDLDRIRQWLVTDEAARKKPAA